LPKIHFDQPALLFQLCKLGFQAATIKADVCARTDHLSALAHVDACSANDQESHKYFGFILSFSDHEKGMEGSDVFMGFPSDSGLITEPISVILKQILLFEAFLRSGLVFMFQVWFEFCLSFPFIVG